ncbi:MAG: hypothetical protein ACRDZ4_14555 [Egibacteraceae bacterium]
MARARTRGRARRNLWKRDRKGHKSASYIGWAYRSDRKKGPRPVMRYLSAAGLSGSALRKYRQGRSTKASTLLRKRTARKRKSGRPRESFHTRPFLVNRGGRRVGTYARFVQRFARKTGMRGPSLMRAAGKAWRGGARRNAEVPGQVTFNRGRKRRSRRNGPVLPYMAWENRRGRGRKRGSRRNGPVLPYASFNPRRRIKASGDVVGALGETFGTLIKPDFWMETVAPMGLGFIGGQFVGGILYGLIQKVGGATVTGSGAVPALARVGSRALGSAAVAGLTLIVTKDGDAAAKVLAGGLVAVLASAIQELFGMDLYSKITGMQGIDDMAADLTEELKARIAESVRSEVARGGEQTGTAAFVTTQDIAPAPHLGPGPRVGEMGSFVTTQDLSTAPQAAAPMVADLSAFSDSMMDMMLV